MEPEPPWAVWFQGPQPLLQCSLTIFPHHKLPPNTQWVGLGQPDELVGKRERRAREGPQAGFESHADWNPGINPVPS